MLTPDESFDVFGSENQMLFQHLKELQEIKCTAVCLDCNRHHSVQVREVFTPMYCNIGEFFNLLQMHIHMGLCEQCGSSNFQSQKAHFVKANPWIFFLDVEGSVLIDCIQDIPKSTKILNVDFTLAYISLHSLNHYTGLFWQQDRWMHYDGRKNGARSTSLFDARKELSNHKLVHVVYFR